MIRFKHFLPPIIALPFMFLSHIFDERILLFIQGLYLPGTDKILHWFVEVESVFFFLIVVSILFLIELKKTEWILPLLTTALISTCASYIGKLIFMRRRPFDSVGFLGLLDSSFPSAHATLGFACATLLWWEFPRIGWFYFLFAGTIGLARIYVRQHYLSDVIAGAILGYLIGLGMVYLSQKYLNPTIKVSKK